MKIIIISKIFSIFAMLNTYVVHSKEINHSPKVDVISPNSVGIKPFAVGDTLLKEKICGIYKITSPSNKIYIGQSINILQRWIDHKVCMSYKKSKLISSFKSHGFDNHKFKIIHECQESELNNLEKYYVDLFQTFNTKHGMNLRDGGGSQGKMSDETKKKLSKLLLGRIVWNKGVPMSEKQRNILRNCQLGRKQSDKEKNKRAVSLQKIYLNIETGIYYFGANDASSSLGIKREKLYSGIIRKQITNLIKTNNL